MSKLKSILLFDYRDSWLDCLIGFNTSFVMGLPKSVTIVFKYSGEPFYSLFSCNYSLILIVFYVPVFNYKFFIALKIKLKSVSSKTYQSATNTLSLEPYSSCEADYF